MASLRSSVPTSCISTRRLLVQLAHVFGHLLELLDARLVVVPVDIHGLHQLVEVLDHGVQASAERAAAGRALSVLSERDDAIALLLDLRVLGAERFTLGLRFLPVSHPFGAPRLEESLSVLEVDTLLLELQRRFFLESGCALDLRVTVLEPREFFAQSGLGFEQSLAATFLAIKRVERLQLHVQSEQRLDGLAEIVQLRSRRLHALELADDPLRVAVQRRFLLLGNIDQRP